MVVPEIQATTDGTATLYRADLDEHYHSVKGALSESEHVYINLAFNHFLNFASDMADPSEERGDTLAIEDKEEASGAARKDADSGLKGVRVFEVGFGTGLNAALTALEAERSRVRVTYYSIELYPLPPEVIEDFVGQYPPDIARMLRAVNSARWNLPVKINDFFTLHKIEANLIEADLPGNVDVVYFDAFAPEKQPELWSECIFTKIHDAMTPGAILTTYCAKGAIRRLLQSLSFLTERLPGPPAGKREVLRATKKHTL